VAAVKDLEINFGDRNSCHRHFVTQLYKKNKSPTQQKKKGKKEVFFFKKNSMLHAPLYSLSKRDIEIIYQKLC